MSASRFHVVDVNPNEATGGGGCVCSETKIADCTGPFVVFYHQSLETVYSPHVVACARCIADADKAVRETINRQLEEAGHVVVDAEVVDDDDVPLI